MDYGKLKQKIKNLLSEKDSTEVKMCEQIGITNVGYHKMIRNESINVNTLESIANYLGVPLWHLLADTKTTATNEEDGYKAKYYQAVEFIAQKLGMPNFKFVSSVAMCLSLFLWAY